MAIHQNIQKFYFLEHSSGLSWFWEGIIFKFNTNTENFKTRLSRVPRKPCFKYSKSGNIKLILLTNLILHEQTFAFLAYFVNAVTYFVFISCNILIFYFNKEKKIEISNILMLWWIDGLPFRRVVWPGKLHPMIWSVWSYDQAKHIRGYDLQGVWIGADKGMDF